MVAAIPPTSKFEILIYYLSHTSWFVVFFSPFFQKSSFIFIIFDQTKSIMIFESKTVYFLSIDWITAFELPAVSSHIVSTVCKKKQEHGFNEMKKIRYKSESLLRD